eukprot:NODE_27003_length_529_cov_3.437811.p2 GENE.NODE_27003_length_529_cov_3.437811~~NODE_27003_length_529_cov_3.437811.p2  ORF type:complete len:69 (-),score=43.20 NODE_27003_length_529_cov_3.437811:67-273(-)
MTAVPIRVLAHTDTRYCTHRHCILVIAQKKKKKKKKKKKLKKKKNSNKKKKKQHRTTPEHTKIKTIQN